MRVAQDCTQRLEDGIKRVEAGIAPAYNQAAHTHNREQRRLSDSNRVPGCTLPLLPWMNSKGELPPAGACILLAISLWLRLAHVVWEGGAID